MSDPKTRRRVAALAAMLLLPLAWLLWPDNRVATAKAARAALNDPALTPEKRREKSGELRKAMSQLSPAQREAFSADDRKRRATEVAGYFKLSAKDKTKFLDERIDRMKGPPQQAGKGPPQQAKGQQAAKGPPPGVQAKGGTPSTPAARDDRRQKRLDSSTPAERALFSQFFRDLEARRKQRGLPPMGGRPA